MSNKLTTLGYFRKRLRDSGYNCLEIFKDFHETDPRAWCMVIDPGFASVFCVCYINYPELGSSYFEFSDGNLRIPGKIKLQTDSFEIIVEYLNKLGISNKGINKFTRE